MISVSLRTRTYSTRTSTGTGAVCDANYVTSCSVRSIDIELMIVSGEDC